MTNPTDLRELLAAATPGKWVVGRKETRGAGDGSLVGLWIECADGARLAEVFGNCRVRTDENVHANAALIVAATNSLPSLLDRLDAAERERDELLKDRDEGWPAHWRVRAMMAEAKLAKARACRTFDVGDEMLFVNDDGTGKAMLADEVLAAVGLQGESHGR